MRDVRGIAKAERQFYRHRENQHRTKAMKPTAENWTPAPADPGIQQDSIRGKAMRAISGGAAGSLLAGNRNKTRETV
jgi:hypothetical protein